MSQTMSQPRPADSSPPRLPLSDPAALVGLIVAVFGAVLVFHEIFARDVHTDLQLHMAMTSDAILHGTWPGNPAYYFLQALAAGWSAEPRALRHGAEIVLGLSVGARYWVAAGYLRRYAAVSGWVAATCAVLLLVAFSLPYPTHYLGQFPSTVWHNSTTILLFPFATLAFSAAVAYLHAADRRALVVVAVASVIGIAVKPTFSLILPFAFVPLVAAHRGVRQALPAALVGAVIMTGVAVEYALIYALNLDSTNSHVVIAPLRMWHAFSLDIPESVAASFAFPIAALVALRGRAVRDLGVQLALLLVAGAVALFCLVAETGPRAGDGNFIWQVYVAMFMLFLSLTASGLREWQKLRLIERALLIVGLGAHVAAGVSYLAYLLGQGSIS